MTARERKKLVKKRRKANLKHVKSHRQRKKDAAIAEKKSDASKKAATAAGKIIARSYSTVQTLSKAVKKVSNAFPESPTRKKAVLARIVSGMDKDDQEELLNVIASAAAKRNYVNPAMTKDIHDFYERDDVSRMSPKMRDVKKRISIDTGVEELLPTRHMVLTVKEAYALFSEERKKAEKGYYH